MECMQDDVGAADGVSDGEQTLDALEAAQATPLSIVLIGVGDAKFEDMDFLKEAKEKGLRITFVNAQGHFGEELSEATLNEIPTHLVSYFTGRGIQPSPAIESDEIVIEPFNEEEEITTDITVSPNGDISVQTDATEENKKPSAIEEMGKKGKSIVMAQAKRQFGRIRKTMERNINRAIDQKVNKMFGIPTGKKPTRRRK